MTAFEADRLRVEQDVWRLLREARADDRGWRRAAGERAVELGGFARGLARVAEDDLGAAVASETLRLGDTPGGRALGEAVERIAGALEAHRRRLAAELAAAAERRVPDPERAVRRLEEALAARLGGGVVLASSTRRAAPAPKRPPRKQARVPKFLLSKFYRAGNLRRFDDRVEVTFHNPLAFCIVQGGDAVIVDGKPFPRERSVLDNGEKRVNGDQLSGSNYLKFAKGGAIKVTLDGLVLPPGTHRLQAALEMRKMGWVELDVKDMVP